MAMKATSFSAPTHVMALTHPFVTPAHARAGGIPLFVDALSRDYAGSDYWSLKDRGVINTKWGIITGNVGHGKSAVMKITAMRLMMTSAGFKTMRTVINDYKSEANESEYGKLSAVTRSTVFRMASMSVNPFETRLFLDKDKQLNTLGIFNMAELLAEFIKREFLSSIESVALVVILGIMLKQDETAWTPGTLEKIARSLTVTQIEDHYRYIDEQLMDQLHKRARRLETDELIEQTMKHINVLTGAVNNFDVSDIQIAGVKISQYYHALLYGTYGSMFGSTHSMYDLYTQRTVTKDWRGLTPSGETLLRTIDNIVRMTAIENGRSDLVPNLNIDDEMHRPMENLVYAKNTAYLSEIARSTSTVYLSATHRLSSIRKGGVGSELYGYGSTVINNLGFGVLGRQQNDPVALDELADRFRLTSAQKHALTTLPPRHFIYVLGDKELPQLIRSFATANELKVLPTNQMNDYMLDRPDPFNERDVRRYAEENGFAYVPPSASLV